MNTYANDVPIAVHVVSTDVPAPVKAKRQRRTVFNTVVLTASEPVQEILPNSENRVVAYIQPIDNDIVLATNLGQGQSKTNTASGAPSPSGAYVPRTNTAPYRLDGNDRIYAAATSTGTNTRVSVTAIYNV